MTFVVIILILCFYYLFIYYWYIKPFQNELRYKSNQLSIINRVSLEFHKSYTLKETLPAILKELMEVISAEGASLFVYDSQKKIYSLKYAAGAVSDKIIGIEIPDGEGIISKAVENNKSMIVNDVSTEESFCQKVDKTSGFKTKSMICVPLIIDNHPIGAFEVINKKGVGHFNFEDLQLLETLSNLTAITVKNALFLKDKNN